MPINGDFSSSPFLHPSLSVILENKIFSKSFPFLADLFLLSHFGPKGQLRRVNGMLQGRSSATSPSVPWRPPKFLAEKAVQEELEVKDVEFEEDHMVVV